MSTKAVNTKAVELEKKISGKLFIGGTQPSADDVKAFNDLLGSGNINVYRWVKHIATFTEAERKAWGAPVKVVLPKGREDTVAAVKSVEKSATAATSTAAPAASAPAKPAEVKPAPAAVVADDDDDIDLFGDATEEETAALEAKKAKDAEDKKKKKVVIAKSSILFDVKAWDDSVDLEALAQKLHAIQKDGLVWGQHKLVPVAFGVKKLQQLIVIEDDKVSGDDLEDMIMGFEDEVQSMDIVAWNKV